MSEVKNNKVDVVYTWVDGEDPDWERKKNSFLKKEQIHSPDQVSDLRYIQKDELKYSLRSLLKYAPWVNHIFIITDKQVPSWLNNSDRVTIVDHSEIIPAEYLPTFNSSVIECYLHKIPELEEQFIYFNDDVFIGKPSKYNDFFKNGIPKVFTSSIFPTKKELKATRTYNMEAIYNSRKRAAQLTRKSADYGLKHGIKPLLKSRLQYVSELIKDEIEAISKEQFRMTPFSLLYTYIFHEIATKQMRPTYQQNIKKNGGFPVFSGFSYVDSNNCLFFFNNFTKLRPLVFCINEISIPLNELTLFSSGELSQKSEFEK